METADFNCSIKPLDVSRTNTDIQFRLATEQDNESLRRLLRDGPMPGWVKLSYEREPDYFISARIEGELTQVIIAEEIATKEIIGFGSRSVRDVFFNGKKQRVGYISQLRVIPHYRGRLRYLRHGYRFCQSLRKEDELPFDITTIVDGNTAAQRLLTRGLPGLPVYDPIAHLSTFALVSRRYKQNGRPNGLTLRQARDEDKSQILEFLQEQNQHLQFADCWCAENLFSSQRHPYLDIDNYVLAIRENKLIGCAALWDQRAFKQNVVRDYKKPLALFRPWFNMLSGLLGQPGLPGIGDVVSQAYLFNFTIASNDTEIGLALLKTMLDQAKAKGLDYVLLGLEDKHPLLIPIKRQLRHLYYGSQIYRVYWPEELDSIPAMDPGLMGLEVSTL